MADDELVIMDDGYWTVRIDSKLRNDLHHRSDVTGVSVAQVVSACVRNGLGLPPRPLDAAILAAGRE